MEKYECGDDMDAVNVKEKCYLTTSWVHVSQIWLWQIDFRKRKYLLDAELGRGGYGKLFLVRKHVITDFQDAYFESEPSLLMEMNML